MRKISAALFSLVCLLFVACSGSENTKVEYFAFQEVKDGNWSMIALDGNVLFKDEFKNAPTVARNGRFFVKNSDGLYEMFDCTEKPKQIGGKYVSVTAFYDGVALVAEVGKPVSIINTDGKVEKLLDNIEGKQVKRVSQFSEGYAVFETEDSLYGAINTSGKCVVKPEYCRIEACSSGKFVAIKKEYKGLDLKDESQRAKVKVNVIDNGGDVLGEISLNKYPVVSSACYGDYISVQTVIDGKPASGIINCKGEVIVKPTTKYEAIGEMRGDNFVYYNGDGFGLANIKGETLIRAKYILLRYDPDATLLAWKNDEKAVLKYIDENDNQIGDDNFVEAMPFSALDGEHAIVKADDKLYSIIDKETKILPKLPDMVNVSLSNGDAWVESDYVDTSKMLGDLKINANGLLGLTFKSTPQNVVLQQVRSGSAPSTKEHPAGTPYWYNYSNAIDISKQAGGVDCLCKVIFSSTPSRQTYKTVTENHYYWTYSRQVSSGYVWNETTPKKFGIEIQNAGRVQGKLHLLMKAFVAKFKSMGKEVKSSGSAALIELNNGCKALVAIKDKGVRVVWGDLSDEELDVDQYAEVEEKWLTETSDEQDTALSPDEEAVD